MPKISIVFSYRNRETVRVKRCLDSLAEQTFSDFEVIFIDYGSTEPHKSGIKELTSRYSFVNHVYNHTIGMPWNRAHALNTGIRIATGNYILFGDIDLIYSPNVLEILNNNLKPNRQIYSSVILLPKEFDQWESLFFLNVSEFPNTSFSGKGGVHLVEKENLNRINGYDEYYAYWGVEDRDLNLRIKSRGVEDFWLDKRECQIYHQWHPKTSNLKNSDFPDKWWEEMNIYFSLNQKNLVRNEKGWGKIYTSEDRPSLRKELISQSITINPVNKLYGDNGKTSTILTITDAWCSLPPGKSLQFSFPKTNDFQNRYYSTLNKAVSWIAKKAGGIFLSADEYNILKSYQDRENNFIPEYDIMYCLWSLIKTHQIHCDYSFFGKDDVVQVTLHKIATNG
ncbi:MAG: glycosyltransferase [Bacteroidota bacterium]